MSVLDIATRPDAKTVQLVFASPPCTGHSRPVMRALVTSFRACELCIHSTARAGRLLCDSPAVRLTGQPEALEVARAATGSCGPNARHLDMPGWR
ncbi:hypothetical protein JVX96_21150 [Variovorax sp. PDNC026]|uniref:hypothetical protein n=1 Tax=Variovorax sp. PDNC026 TaxID=2811425 RepID=UPI0019668844|nr:hypothetical protein [Variovorax sp. PDNC026]QRY30577.1 hypothetical protein JVX96_21150 [Variovorax sp. PDNC026]